MLAPPRGYCWALLGLDIEVVFEEGSMGRNAEEGLTEVNKNGNLQDGVRIQIYQFDLVEVEKAAKEVAGGESKPVLDELLKDHRFACARWLAIGRIEAGAGHPRPASGAWLQSWWRWRRTPLCTRWARGLKNGAGG